MIHSYASGQSSFTHVQIATDALRGRLKSTMVVLSVTVLGDPAAVQLHDSSSVDASSTRTQADRIGTL